MRKKKILGVKNYFTKTGCGKIESVWVTPNIVMPKLLPGKVFIAPLPGMDFLKQRCLKCLGYGSKNIVEKLNIKCT